MINSYNIFEFSLQSCISRLWKIDIIVKVNYEELKISCNFSGVQLEDKTVTTATDQEIVCRISGLEQNTLVTWIGPDNNEISISDTNNYVIDQGTLIFGNKASTLTIKTAKLAVLSSGDVFKCKLKSAQYPDHSPDVVKEMTLTLLTLGEIFTV